MSDMEDRVTMKDILKRVGEGVISTSMDMILWNIAYWGTISLPQSTSGQVWRAKVEADRFLRQVHYDQIKQAVNNAKRHGYIKRKRRHALPEITATGRARLARLIPRYDQRRVWDKRMHLITYDIPEERHDDRDLLREFLRRLGCGKLQESVWVTPYNPIDTLRSFIAEKELEGTIIVSDMGQDASIGEEDLGSLIARVYQLAALNDRYQAWLAKADTRHPDHWAVVGYLSILQDDPQLPSSILPSWWVGDRAYQRIKHLIPKL